MAALSLGVLATLLGYVGWTVGLDTLGPTRAVTFAYAIPPLAVLFGALTLDEPVTPWLTAVGCAPLARRRLNERRTMRLVWAETRRTATRGCTRMRGAPSSRATRAGSH